MTKFTPKFLMFLIAFLFISCASSEKFILLNNKKNIEVKSLDFQAVLQPDDVLLIVISTDNPYISQPYNLNNISVSNNEESGNGLQKFFSYQIDQQGNIQIPNLGIVKAAGKTRNELVQEITRLLEGKLDNPIITIRILNFKISVLGEVNKPGSFPINSERITLLEALSMAGDLTIYGKRDAILIIREKNGVKSFQKVDITNRDFVNSPYYYLSQNDVVFVEPNKTKVNSSLIGPNVTVGLTAISLLITILAITIR